MSHAYNGVNGTFLPGTYTGPGPASPTPTRQIPNAERQAVGLATTADPYDFGDGSGPITHNPTALSENGLRAAMGLEWRPSYAICRFTKQGDRGEGTRDRMRTSLTSSK